MSAALASYLSALDARDSRERAHEVYINAYTQFADRTAAQHSTGSVATAAAAPSTTTAPAPTSTKGTSSPAAPSTTTNTNTTLTQLQTALAASQKSRAELESTVSSLTATLTTLQAASTAQQTRIAALEKHRAQLERRGKDKQEELKGKGRFVEEIQDEMVALNLQLNMAEKERERLKAENEELTKRWVRKMEEEVGRMNRESGWEVQGR